MSRRTRRYMDRHFHRLEWASPRRAPLSWRQELALYVVMVTVVGAATLLGVAQIEENLPLDEGRWGSMTSIDTAGGE